MLLCKCLVICKDYCLVYEMIMLINIKIICVVLVCFYSKCVYKIVLIVLVKMLIFLFLIVYSRYLEG